MTAIRAFISYSWSSIEHEEWVDRLARNLQTSGIDITYDKWDLKPGQEANSFMEKMVSDPAISKVIIVCDSEYCKKSDTRKGGAGTEAQIISSEIFSKEDQDKFVAVVTEMDDAGKACVPTYYTSRIYIDFTDESRYSEKFEELLRWICDKSIHQKPPLGKLPQYITNPDNTISLSTGIFKNRAIDGLTNSKTFAYPATKEYLDTFSSELEKFRLKKDIDFASDEFMDNLNSSLPYRDEFIEIAKAISVYTDDIKYIDLLHSFFEKFMDYFYPSNIDSNLYSHNCDNFKLFAHELFLHTGSILISEGKYIEFNHLINEPFYFSNTYGNGLKNFTEFRDYLESLSIRKEKLNLNRISLVADFIHDRAEKSSTKFQNIMQVDFILYIRANLLDSDNHHHYWHPDTLAYAGRWGHTFEIFERARSKKFFEKIRPILGNISHKDLTELVERIESNPQSIPRFDYSPILPKSLLGISNLCTIP